MSKVHTLVALALVSGFLTSEAKALDLRLPNPNFYEGRCDCDFKNATVITDVDWGIFLDDVTVTVQAGPCTFVFTATLLSDDRFPWGLETVDGGSSWIGLFQSNLLDVITGYYGTGANQELAAKAFVKEIEKGATSYCKDREFWGRGFVQSESDKMREYHEQMSDGIARIEGAIDSAGQLTGERQSTSFTITIEEEDTDTDLSWSYADLGESEDGETLLKDKVESSTYLLSK